MIKDLIKLIKIAFTPIKGRDLSKKNLGRITYRIHKRRLNRKNIHS